MHTRTLYYEDCHLSHFTATVTSCEPSKGGYLVTLDATAFYPEGGGQPCDTGTLGHARVTDVQEENGNIYHLCDAPLTVGQPVEGQIDFARRFDFMQQHTGEHIVSGLIHKYFGWHNTGFHIGGEFMTVDFDGPVSPEDLARIEREANQAVWENIPLRCWTPEKEELPRIFYRTKRELPWPVRIVQVPGYDSCACCGIHVAATGEVGLIKIFSCVKFHEGIRLEMACGRMALEYMTAAFEQNRQVSQAFSARILETGEAAPGAEELFQSAKGHYDAAAEALAEVERIRAENEAAKAAAAAPASEGLTCTGCGAVNPPGTRFCSSCGTKLEAPSPAPEPEAARTCSACGAPLADGMKFCGECGAKNE